MDLGLAVLACLTGYLVGSLSFSRILLRLLTPEASLDHIPLELGDDHGEVELMMGAGANKAAIILGQKWGIIIAILDMTKIILPLILFRYLFFPTDPYFLYVAAFGLVGHNWPLYHRFKGGRGHSVMLGSLLIIDPLAVISTLLLGTLLSYTLFGSMVVGSFLWLIMIIPWFFLSTFDLNFVLYAVFINIIAIVTIIPEIRIYLQLRKEGKVEAYKDKFFQSTAQFRGMLKMDNYFKSLGKWRFVIGIITLIITLVIYAFLPSIS